MCELVYTYTQHTIQLYQPLSYLYIIVIPALQVINYYDYTKLPKQTLTRNYCYKMYGFSTIAVSIRYAGKLRYIKTI